MVELGSLNPLNLFNFLQQHSNMEEFLNYVYLIVNPVIENYISRSFTNLGVGFGCTSGQHRSVYTARRLAKHISVKYGVKVELKHLEEERKGWKN
jgi:RNase adaptor protein for sRNA GlmZ degradation